MKKESIFKNTLLFCIAFVMRSFALFLILILLGCSNRTYKFELLSIDNDKELTGSFFIGTGAIETSEYYYMFIRNNNDRSIVRIKLDTYRVKIYEGYKEPYLKCVDWCDEEFSFYDLVRNTNPCSGWIELYVPQNTIIKEFKLK